MSTRAFLVAGTKSGSGKTTISLGLMTALARQGMKVQPFKCGPDFIDPSLHKMVTGRNSRNLDLWMAGRSFSKSTFNRHSQDGDISVIEGVMGMYDGGQSSSAALAAELGVPVVLVVDVSSTAESAAAIVSGFESLNPRAAVKGVILNRVASPRHLQLVSDAIKEHCQAEILGHLPHNLDFQLPGRHLGLYMGEEKPLAPETIEELAQTISSHIDLDRLCQMARLDKTPTRAKAEIKKKTGTTRIGIARDRAFCFYYQDNLDLLTKAGAELVFFSPLTDQALPADLDGIYLGGGYPELHAKTLSNNQQMLTAINSWAEAEKPLYAECGGFMYLTEGINDGAEFHAMAGVFPVKAAMQKKRASLGYREITMTEDHILGAEGCIIHGHEFHYSNIDPMPATIRRLYQVNNGKKEGYLYKNTLGGYIHLHFGSHPQGASDFIKFCQNKAANSNNIP